MALESTSDNCLNDSKFPKYGLCRTHGSLPELNGELLYPAPMRRPPSIQQCEMDLVAGMQHSRMIVGPFRSTQRKIAQFGSILPWGYFPEDRPLTGGPSLSLPFGWGLPFAYCDLRRRARSSKPLSCPGHQQAPEIISSLSEHRRSLRVRHRGRVTWGGG